MFSRRDDPVLDHVSIRRSEGKKEFIAVDAGLRNVRGVVGKRVGFIDKDAMRVPLQIAAFAPFGEVLLGNGGSIEELVDDLDDFGFGVEPFDEFVSWLAVVDAIVEFVPDFVREVGYFTVTCFHDFRRV